MLADLLLADQSTHGHKNERNTYIPLKIILLLLIKEDNTDSEECRNALRRILVI